MNNWSIIPISKFGEYSFLWQKLNDTYNNSHPILSIEFIGAIVEHFGQSGNLFLGVERKHGEVTTLILLEKRSSLVWQTFNPSQITVSPFVTSHTDLDQAWFRRLISSLPGFVLLFGMLKYDKKYQASLVLPDSLVKYHQYQTTIDVSLKCDFDEYWGLRKKKLRDNIKRYTKRVLKEYGEIELEEIFNPEDVSLHVEKYGGIESCGWKGKIGTAISVDNDQGRFYLQVLNAFKHIDGMRMFHLYFDGVLVSSRMAIKKGDIIVFLKTTYNEEFSSFSPGRLQLHRVLEALCKKDKGAIVEFYTDANSDQLQWAGDQRPISHVNIYRSSIIKLLTKLF